MRRVIPIPFFNTIDNMPVVQRNQAIMMRKRNRVGVLRTDYSASRNTSTTFTAHDKRSFNTVSATGEDIVKPQSDREESLSIFRNGSVYLTLENSVIEVMPKVHNKQKSKLSSKNYTAVSQVTAPAAQGMSDSVIITTDKPSSTLPTSTVTTNKRTLKRKKKNPSDIIDKSRYPSSKGHRRHKSSRSELKTSSSVCSDRYRGYLNTLQKDVVSADQQPSAPHGPLIISVVNNIYQPTIKTQQQQQHQYQHFESAGSGVPVNYTHKVVDCVSSRELLYTQQLPGDEQPQQQTTTVPNPSDTVLLVNTEVEETFIILPETKQIVSQIERSRTTLEVLRKGLTSYMNARRYDDGTCFHDDRIEIFCCKLPQKKKYEFYKRVRVLEPHHQSSPAHRENSDELYETFDLINRYVKCFATLAEFCFEFNVPRPLVNTGLSNVLIVDKVWNFNSEKRVYIPSYKILEKDTYTDYVISTLKSFYKCKSVKFISTLHTALFANYDVLAEPRTVTRDDVCDAQRSTQSTGQEFSPTIEKPAVNISQPTVDSQSVMFNRPLKKRKIVTSNLFGAGPSETTSSHEKRIQDQDVRDMSNVCHPTNPTLIVLKQPIVSGEQHLVCPISIEIHLASHIVYN